VLLLKEGWIIVEVGTGRLKQWMGLVKEDWRMGELLQADWIIIKVCAGRLNQWLL